MSGSELALAIQAEARRAAANGRAVVLAEALSVDPLVLDDLASARLFHEEDIAVAQHVRARMGDVAPGDVVVLLRSRSAYAAVGVLSDSEPGGVTEADLAALEARMTVPLLDALPASPHDGQVIDFSDAAVLQPKNLVWRLRYNAASSSPYKWSPIGAVPLYDAVATDQAKAAGGSYGDVATVGPSIVLPLAGDYDYDAAANSYVATANNQATMQITQIGGTTPAVDVTQVLHAAATSGLNHTQWGRLLAQPASREIRLQYSSAVVSNWRYRKLRVWPVCVG